MKQFSSISRTRFNRMLDWAEQQLSDPNSRYHSWEHAYRQWCRFERLPGKSELDLTALHLAFYLASWGMLRGSSGLLQRDYKVFYGVVKMLKQRASEGWSDCMFRASAERNPNELADRLAQLRHDVAQELELIPPTPPPDSRRITATDTLVSKILLNTLACVPAWDRNVRVAISRIDGFRSRGSNGFSPKFLAEFIQFARVNQPLLVMGQERLQLVRPFRFPLTRILDLYLWYEGQE